MSLASAKGAGEAGDMKEIVVRRMLPLLLAALVVAAIAATTAVAMKVSPTQTFPKTIPLPNGWQPDGIATSADLAGRPSVIRGWVGEPPKPLRLVQLAMRQSVAALQPEAALDYLSRNAIFHAE
jgi:hypothetical protein